ncbi:MAG: hypothetical protein SFV24_05585 [Gemmatimonadales bacterium]|nr:hypothetical protein [Gemmatimonadales bacterium]
MRPRAGLGSAIGVAAALAGCGENGPAPATRPLDIVAGPALADTITAHPIQGLVAEVRDASGTLLPGTAVRYSSVILKKDGFDYASMFVAPVSGDQFGTLVTATTNERGRSTALVGFGVVAGLGGIEVAVPELGLVDTVRYTITPGQPFGVRLLPKDSALAVGRTLTLRGGVVDRFLNARSDPVAYSATAIPSGAGTITPNGQVTAAAAGQIEVIGSAGSARDTIRVSVVPAGTVAGWDPVTGHIVEVSLDGTGRRNLTQTPFPVLDEFEPEWSRDGNSFVFTTGGKIAALFLPTGGLAMFTTPPSPYWPTFTPDGQRIYFNIAGTGDAQIARIDRNGTNFVIVKSGGFDARVSFAPDGRTFTYHSVIAGDPFVAKFDVATGTGVPTTRRGIFPEWSFQGDRIAYFTPEGELRMMNADESNDHALAPPGVYGGPIGWSPDGQWLLLGRPGVGFELLGVAGAAAGVTVHPILPSIAGARWRP